MVVAGGFFTFVLLQTNDVGVLEVFGNLPSVPEELEQAEKLLSKCLTTHLEDFGWCSIRARGLASLQLRESRGCESRDAEACPELPGLRRWRSCSTAG